MSKKKPNAYIKYTSIAFEIAAPIVLGVLFGRYLDQKFEYEKAWTATFTLLGVFIGLYMALKDLIRQNKED